MKNIFGSLEKTPEIKPLEIPANDKNSIPSEKTLFDKLKSILSDKADKVSEGFAEKTPLQDRASELSDTKSPMTITLADGTRIELPHSEKEQYLAHNENFSEVYEPEFPLSKIEEKINHLSELIENHPEKSDMWNKLDKAVTTLSDPESSLEEIRSANAVLSHIKGDIIELAAKDVLREAGLDVEDKQRVVEGENGGTKPDIIATNNTDSTIHVFGLEISPTEKISVECKCGGSLYLENQLNNHIPNQLSGHEGRSVLLVTSDVNNVKEGLAENVCESYGSTLSVLNLSVSDVENLIKEIID